MEAASDTPTAGGFSVSDGCPEKYPSAEGRLGLSLSPP